MRVPRSPTFRSPGGSAPGPSSSLSICFAGEDRSRRRRVDGRTLAPISAQAGSDPVVRIGRVRVGGHHHLRRRHRLRTGRLGVLRGPSPFPSLYARASSRFPPPSPFSLVLFLPFFFFVFLFSFLFFFFFFLFFLF